MEGRLLPDIDRYIDESEELGRRRSGSAPLLSDAEYVVTTPAHASDARPAYKRESDRSSSTNYASERNTDDSSGLGLDLGGASDDLLICGNYHLRCFRPRKGDELDTFEENIYEPVVYLPMECHNDSGIDQEDGPSPESDSKPRSGSDSTPVTAPRPKAKPRCLSFNAGGRSPMLAHKETKEEAKEKDVTDLDDLSPDQVLPGENHYDELPTQAARVNGNISSLVSQKPAVPPKPMKLQRRHTKSGERQSGEKRRGMRTRRNSGLI